MQVWVQKFEGNPAVVQLPKTVQMEIAVRPRFTCVCVWLHCRDVLSFL